MTIVQYKRRWHLEDDDGTVLGSYETREQAVSAMQWWEELARKLAARAAQVAS